MEGGAELESDGQPSAHIVFLGQEQMATDRRPRLRVDMSRFAVPITSPANPIQKDQFIGTDHFRPTPTNSQ
ncbi:hypothetical protein MY11210_002255 [Beauveria gryllotalpidicola]